MSAAGVSAARGDSILKEFGAADSRELTPLRLRRRQTAMQKGKVHTAATDGNLELLTLLLEEGEAADTPDARCQTPLHLAAKAGNVSAVCLLLSYGSNVDSEDVDGRTPLHAAVESGEVEVVAKLLTEGADSQTRERVRGRTPFHLATLADNAEILKVLLAPMIESPWEGRRALKIGDKDKRTVLHLSTHNGLVGTTELLLSAGAQVNVSDIEGLTPMHTAIRTRQHGVCTTLLTLLLDAGGDVSAGVCQEEGSLLHAASAVGCVSCIKLLADRGAPLNCKDNLGRAPIHLAVSEDRMDALTYLLDNGADLEAQDKRQQRAIHHAILADSADMLTRLLTLEVDLSAVARDGLTLFQFALSKRKFRALEVMVRKNVTDVGEETRALHYCADVGSQPAIDILLDNGHDIDEIDSQGRTALHHAICSGHEEIILHLLSRGASIATPDRTGASPLHYAVRWGGSDAVLRRLVKKNGCVNAVDRLGRTPLHYAASKKSIMSDMYILINNGAKLNSVDARGLTPLHLAARLGNESLVRILLESDAKHDIKDIDDFMPIDHAKENDHKCIIKRLENFAIQKEREKDPRFGLYERKKKDDESGDGKDGEEEDDVLIQSKYRIKM